MPSILRLRTRDNLNTLLNQGFSEAWCVGKNRLGW
jgi:hypothetical protein